MKVNRCSFYSASQNIFLFIRCLGFFPLAGLKQNNSEKLRFVLKSPYTILLIISLFGQTLTGLSTFVYALINGSPRIIYKAIFCIVSFLITIRLVQLSYLWPKIIAEVSEIEKRLPFVKITNSNVKIMFVVFYGCFLADHLIELLFYIKFTGICYDESFRVETYIGYVVPWTKQFFGYCPWISWIFEVFRIQSKILVCFPDLFIIIVGMYLTSCFDEFTKYVARHQNDEPPTWNILRMHYTNLCNIVNILDKTIGFFVLLSFGNNLLLICVNLFKTIRKDLAHDLRNCSPDDTDGILNLKLRSLHFMSSIAFLLLRVFAVGLFAGRVQAATRQPALIIYNLKPDQYNAHTKRFLEQIHTLSPSLSGLQLFFVTNSAILSMIASIITYELVILQFTSLKF